MNEVDISTEVGLVLLSPSRPGSNLIAGKIEPNFFYRGTTSPVEIVPIKTKL